MDELTGWVCLAFAAAWIVIALICCGWHLNFDDQNAKPVIRESATLFSISLTSAVALVIGQIETNRPIIPFIVAFTAISFSCTIGMVFMLMARSKATGVPTAHAYDWASIWSGRVMLWVSLLLTAAVVWLALDARLPGQSYDFETPLAIGEPVRHDFSDETQGISVPVKLSRAQFPKGVPSKLFMVVTLRDDLSRSWSVHRVDGYVGLSTEHEMDPAPSHFNKKTNPNQSIWYLDGLKFDKTYNFKILVHSPKAKGKEAQPMVDSLLKAARSDKGISVVVQSREK